MTGFDREASWLHRPRSHGSTGWSVPMVFLVVLGLLSTEMAPVTSLQDCLGKESLCLSEAGDRNLWTPCSKGCGCCYTRLKTAVTCCGPNVTDVPFDLPKNTTHLTFINTHIINLSGAARNGTGYSNSHFCRYKDLIRLSFRDNSQLQVISQGAFDFICASPVRYIFIETSPKLTMIKRGALGQFSSLEQLRIRGCGLTEVPEWGDFTVEGALTELDLKHNLIKRIKRNAFSDITGAIGDLILVGNDIATVDNYAFNGVVVAAINLADNERLQTLGEDAFSNTSKLRTLDLSNTSIEALPTNGLGKLKNLTIQNVPTLKIFPPVLRFLSVKNMSLTYPYHCCAFKYPRKQNKALYQQLKEELKKNCNSTNITSEVELDNKRVARGLRAVLEDIKKHDFLTGDLIVQQLSLGDTYDIHDPSLVSLVEDIPHGEVIRIIRRARSVDDHRSRGSGTHYTSHVASPDRGKWLPGTVAPNSSTVQRCGIVFEGFKDRDCTPQPDALNPCEDVMGYLWLRVTVWLVVTTAILGNFIVLTVTSSCKMTVGKFLMCNLAIADFCLGLYLLILAVYDLHTSGVYFAYAIAWQTEGGCQIAGFLSTFSICLSIFTLSVITLERWYAISHAINLSKRLRMRQAMFIMACGWACALIMAALPLIGVSSYGKTSLCLPMDTDTTLSEIYVMVLLFINALAFVVIAVCYFDMYRQVTNPGNTTAAGRNDANIAKRMAVLVFTDFLCFFPIALFGITAAAGMPLITVTQSKILLVFFFPLNSCANPFLYAIFTKQFKKDLFRNLNKCNLCVNIAARYRAVYTSTPLSNSLSRASQSAPADQSWCGAICSCCICYGTMFNHRDNENLPRGNTVSRNSRGNSSNDAVIVENPSPVNGIRLLHGSAEICVHLTIKRPTKDFTNLNSYRNASHYMPASLASVSHEGPEAGPEVAIEDAIPSARIDNCAINLRDKEESDMAGHFETNVTKSSGETMAVRGMIIEQCLPPERNSMNELDMTCLHENCNGVCSDDETKSYSSDATQEEVTSLGLSPTRKMLQTDREGNDLSYFNTRTESFARKRGNPQNGHYMECSTLLGEQNDTAEQTCIYNTKC